MNDLIRIIKKILELFFKAKSNSESKEKINSDIVILKPSENHDKKEANSIVSKKPKKEIVMGGITIKSDLITEEDFLKVFPKANKKLIEILNVKMRNAGIATNNRIAHFLAQCGHESNGFTVFNENLNYSRSALLRVFKKYFNESNVDDYARKPQKIANLVYANRMGNGDVKSGDGWRYRGRGIIQLTGKNNYSLFAEYIGKSLPETLKYINTLEGRVRSAIWFWKANSLNEIADKNDVVLLTKKINGGRNGLKHRTELTEKLFKILKGGCK